eukprot:5837094-Pyramimonas_sp.AAC.1
MQRMAMLRQQPDPSAAIGALTPFSTPRRGQATGSPTSSPIAAPTQYQPAHEQSALDQQRLMQRQHQTAMSEMRLLGT